MAASQDTTDILRNATFSHLDGPAASVTAADLLLGGVYDPAKLHPMSGLSDNLDYLLLDDDKVNELPGSGTAIPSRGWSDDLCYGTGTMYLTGPFSFPSSFISHLLLPFIPFWSFVRPGANSFRLFYIIHSLPPYHQSYCSRICHMLTRVPQGSALVVSGVCAKEFVVRLQCRMPACVSTVFSIPSLGEEPSSGILLVSWVCQFNASCLPLLTLILV